ncbi:MAG: hypothetical protein ABFR33_07345 [Verrucomicrobiota bacterium]
MSNTSGSSGAEIDYLAVRDGRIYPVEVKSGSGGRLKSLHPMLQAYPNCPQGLVLYSGPCRELPEQNWPFCRSTARPLLAIFKLQARFSHGKSLLYSML